MFFIEIQINCVTGVVYVPLKASPNTCTHTTKMAITSQPSTEAALNYMVVPEIKIVTLEFNAKII